MGESIPADTQELAVAVVLLNKNMEVQNETMKSHGDKLDSIADSLADLVVIEQKHTALSDRVDDHGHALRDHEQRIDSLESTRDKQHVFTSFAAKWLPTVMAVGLVGSLVLGVLWAASKVDIGLVQMLLAK